VVTGLNFNSYRAVPTLETLVRGAESPRLAPPEVVEGPTLGRIPLSGPPVVGFAAFLNGIQQSRIVLHSGLVPIVHGTVAAVIRVRRDRRLTTHAIGPKISRALFAPRQLVPAHLWDDLVPLGVVDTGSGAADAHPSALLERAIHLVEQRREAAERFLAEAWVDTAPLWIDGPLSVNSSQGIGVVRTHRTLYAESDTLPMLCELAVGERTSVFRVRDNLSWYLRLRDPAGRQPLWGLLRIEVAAIGEPAERADLVSRWVLAESTPLALPDPRWDTLVYGVRDCEEYLRAIC
jgi:hypothetical protein